jgi:hypothetical protein
MIPILGNAKTIADLIAVLETQDPERTWYGWDDGSIIVVDQEGWDKAIIESGGEE